MNITLAIINLGNAIWSFPFLTFLGVIGCFVTIALGFVQFRYFVQAWRLVFAKSDRKADGATLTPIQAFINTLGASIGNGSIAGVATAIAAGGPGSVFWMIVLGTVFMAVRYAEVYLSTYFIGKKTFHGATGGPMLYLSQVPAGNILAFAFAFFCLAFSISSGNAIQANSIAIGLHETWAVSPWISGVLLFVFIGYAMLGGSKRIIAVSDKLVPFKVVIFLITAIIVLVYHAAAILPAIKLIIKSAFSFRAAMGGFTGATMLQAMRYGFARGLFANEAGIGTAAILFGATKGKNPVNDGLLSMLGVFITTHIVCFAVALTIMASGVWSNGLTSTALTISAYNTVFGSMGGWIVTFLAVSFGVSVLVTYAFIGKQCWEFLFGKSVSWLYTAIYAAATICGAVMQVQVLWGITDIINAGMISINLFGILWLIGIVRKGLVNYSTTKH